MRNADDLGGDLHEPRIMTATRKRYGRDAMSAWEVLGLDGVSRCVGEMPLLTLVAFLYCIGRNWKTAV